MQEKSQGARNMVLTVSTDRAALLYSQNLKFNNHIIYRGEASC